MSAASGHDQTKVVGEQELVLKEHFQSRRQK